MKEPLSLEARIQAHYEDLPPAEKRLGDLLLVFPGDIATYSAGELADTAGTSKAAASRFFQRLGYKDFNEARRQVREAKRWGSPVYVSSRKAAGKEVASSVDEHLNNEIQNLTRTMEGIRPDVLREVAEALNTARRVYVVGFLNNHLLGLHLQRQLLLTRSDVVMLPRAAGQSIGEDLVDLGSQDLLVVIGMRRRNTAIKRIMEISRAQGAHILLIADPSVSQTAKLANWTLTCQVSSSSLDSYSSVMSVLNLLCTTLFQQSVRDGYQRLKGIESLYDQLDTFC